MDQPKRDPSKASGPGPAPCQVTSLSLLERVRAHDPEAWRRLVRLYQPLLLAWCARGGVNATDAEDVPLMDVRAVTIAGSGEETTHPADGHA